MIEIKIITVATKPGGYLKWLKESCIRNGTELIVLGMGQEWKGYISKYVLIREYLENLDENIIICFIDAYDVLMLQHIDKLIERFINITKNTEYKLVCAKDIDTLLPIGNLLFSVEKGNIRINSGTYIGYCNFLKNMYDWCIKKFYENNIIDDQELLNMYYCFNKKYIYIDTRCKIFKTSPIIYYNYVDLDTIFIHRLGNNEMVTLLLYYRYDISYEEIKVILKDTKDFLVKKIPYHTARFFEKIPEVIYKF